MLEEAARRRPPGSLVDRWRLSGLVVPGGPLGEDVVAASGEETRGVLAPGPGPLRTSVFDRTTYAYFATSGRPSVQRV